MSPSKSLLAIVGGGAAFLTAAALFSARLIVRPGRIRVWSTPLEDEGLAYEDVEFEASDGVRLAGWFIPAAGATSEPAPTIVVLHGWPWNRMGTRASSPLNDLPGSQTVLLLPLMKRFHDEGYHVLTFDMRNFGDSEQRGVITGGLEERRDLLGALRYLGGRTDVDMERIGALGFSNGGCAVIFALPETDQIRAAIAVQPTTASVFMDGYAHALMGPVAKPVGALTMLLYQMAGGPPFASIQPAEAALRAGDTPVLYVQGTGDRWGSPDDVARMVANTPRGTAVYPETSNRFEGYRHVLAHPEVLLDFFGEHLGPASGAPSAAREP